MPSRSWSILAFVTLIIQLTVVVVALLTARGGVLPVVDVAAQVVCQARRPALAARRRVRVRWRERRGKQPASAGQEPVARPPDQEPSAEGGADEPTDSTLADPARWGLGRAQCAELPGAFLAFWQSFAACFRTKTRDASHHAYQYLNGLLRMDGERNFAAIGRATDAGGENIQHFMSNSPWSSDGDPAPPGPGQGDAAVGAGGGAAAGREWRREGR